MGEDLTSHLVCNICMLSYDTKNRRPLDLGCGHCYCEGCIGSHPQSFRRCPECRTASKNMHLNVGLLRIVGHLEQENLNVAAPSAPSPTSPRVSAASTSTATASTSQFTTTSESPSASSLTSSGLVIPPCVAPPAGPEPLRRSLSRPPSSSSYAPPSGAATALRLLQSLCLSIPPPHQSASSSELNFGEPSCQPSTYLPRTSSPSPPPPRRYTPLTAPPPPFMAPIPPGDGGGGSNSILSCNSYAAAFFVLLYFCFPIDLIPDFIPVLGYMDDMLVLAWTIWFYFFRST